MLELKERPDDAYVQSGDSRENNHISHEYLKMQLKYLGEKRVAQNIMGQFVDSGGEIIPSRYVDRALVDPLEIERLRSESGAPEYFISGWDLARKQTATVGITVAVRGDVCIVVDLVRIKKWDWNVILAKIRNRQRRYPGRLVIDATGLGDVIVSQLADFNPTSFVFTTKSKAELLTNLELFHSMGRVKYGRWELPDEGGRVWALEDELRAARWDDNNRYDGVMALALALWPLYKPDAPLIKPRLSKF
jgi:hypothetical protein